MKLTFLILSITALTGVANAQTLVLESDVQPIVMLSRVSVDTEREPEVEIAVASEPDLDPPEEQMATAQTEEPDRVEISRLDAISVDANAPKPSEPDPSSSTPSQKGPRFVCIGTRPFWSLKIESTGMSFELSGFGLRRYATPLATSSENSASSVTHFTSQGEDGASINALLVSARLNGGLFCNDGMSDHEYEYSVFLNRDGQILNGCCWIEREPFREH